MQRVIKRASLYTKSSEVGTDLIGASLSNSLAKKKHKFQAHRNLRVCA